MSYTQEKIHGIAEAQRAYFRSGETLDVAWRTAQLKKLKQAVLDREDLLRIYKTICLPQAIASVEENVNRIFKTYNLPPVNLARPKPVKYN